MSACRIVLTELRVVQLQAGSMFAAEVTLCATETLFSRVCQHVASEITNSFARVVALCAAEGIFP